jgi:hypothetical protein
MGGSIFRRRLASSHVFSVSPTGPVVPTTAVIDMPAEVTVMQRL